MTSRKWRIAVLSCVYLLADAPEHICATVRSFTTASGPYLVCRQLEEVLPGATWSVQAARKTTSGRFLGACRQLEHCHHQSNSEQHSTTEYFQGSCKIRDMLKDRLQRTLRTRDRI